MTRIPSSNDVSWREYKERGRDAFQSEDYDTALSSYRSALSTGGSSIPDPERQILLSNSVACRLKIVEMVNGGTVDGDTTAYGEVDVTAMASAAVEEAKECVRVNDRWAKGHIRLATAYIALGGHSNDACNSLQKALSLDPSNSNARTMLMKELRRDRVGRTNSTVSADGNSSSGSFRGDQSMPEPSAPPAEEMGTTGPSPTTSTGSSASYREEQRRRYHQQQTQNQTSQQHQQNYDIDDSPSLSERIQFQLARTTNWYFNEISEDTRTLIKVLLCLTVLYVAMGGRFGLDSVFGSNSDRNAGHYDGDSAYDRFYGRAGTEGGGSSTASSQSSSYATGSGGYQSNSGGYGAGGSTSSYYGQSQRQAYDSYEYAPRRSHSSRQSLHPSNLFDGSPLSIVVLVLFGFTCHYFGINPFHALWMLNMMTGNRGRRGMHRNMGMMGMGYGMMNAGMRRRRGG